MAKKKSDIFQAFAKYFEQWPDIESITFFISEDGINDLDVLVNDQLVDYWYENATHECNQLMEDLIEQIKKHKKTT